MPDLEDQLRGLTTLSPPTKPALTDDAMHARAARHRTRRRMVTAVPIVAAVVALVAGLAVFSGTRESVQQVDTAGQPATTVPTRGLAPRDLELLDVIQSVSELRHQLNLEGIDSAVYTSTNMTGADALHQQRQATDQALASYQTKVTAADPGRDAPATRDALKQADSRLRTLPTVRKSVDAIQTDPVRLVGNYSSVVTDLAAIERALTRSTDNPALFRGIFSHSNLTVVTDTEANGAQLLTIAVDVRFYAAVLPSGGQPMAQRDGFDGRGCGEDAAAGAENCPIYAQVLTASNDVGHAEQAFDDYAGADQKQVKRYADVGSAYDELKRHALDDGQGHNDLTGTAAGTTAVEPAVWLDAARDRIDKLAEAEAEVLDLVRQGK